MKSLFTKHRFFIASLFLMLIFYLWIAAQIPYTHDDWDWGVESGIQHLLTADINSRYAGNLIEVILTRSTFLKILVMGIVFTLIPFTVAVFAGRLTIAAEGEYSDSVRAILFCFSNLMLLLLPKDVWQQTNGWVAGFSNFVISGLGLLLYFLCLRGPDPPTKEFRRSGEKSIGLFVFGIAIQLFLENLTVFFFFVSALFLIAGRKQKSVLARAAPLFLGNLIALLIMFSSSIYSSLWKTGYAVGTYRHLMYDPARPLHAFIAESGLRYLGEFVPQIVLHDGILVGCIAGMMAIAMLMSDKKRAARVVLSGINFAFFLYYVYSYFKGSPFADIRHDFGTIVLQPLITGIDCTYVALMIFETVILFKADRRVLFWLLVLWVSPFLIIAPMIMINTVGPRSFYTTDICFVLTGSIVLSLIVSGRRNRIIAVISALCFIALAGLGIRWIKIYEPIGRQNRERESIIETTVSSGGNQITFSQYPNLEYLWFPDPVEADAWRISCFKEFYHIPEKVDIRFESWG